MTVTHTEAVKAINRLDQPAGMYLPSWRRLQKLLRVIAKHLPDPYPCMRRLSKMTGIPLPTVSRLLSTAEEVGLISRSPIKYGGSYRYRLNFVSDPVSVSAQTETEEELRSSLPSVEKTEGRRMARPAASPPRKPNKWAGACCVCGFGVEPGDGLLHGRDPVHRFCDSGETDREQLKEHVMNRREAQRQLQEDIDGPIALGEDPNPAPVTTSVKTTPAVRAASHFETRWLTDALRLFPHWRGEHRCMHTGAAIGYIHGQFLSKGYSVEHVEAYIDAFYDDLLDLASDLQPKEGQTAWQLFTGWWGRVPVEDPREAREAREEHDRWQVVARQQAEAARVITDAARERVFAAMNAGLDPDPADLKAAGLPLPSPTKRRIS